MKNKTRSLLALLVAGTMAASLLAGCGGSSDSGSDSSATEQTDAAETKTDDAAADTDTAADTASDADTAEDTGAADAAALAELGGDGKSTDYTWLIGTAELSNFYLDYNENPIYKDYWQPMQWDPYGTGERQMTIAFTAPTAGSESDFINTLLATGDYMDVMDASRISSTAGQLYDDGLTLDLTELVETFMPNYMAWIEEHPDFGRYVYNNVDGEQKILQIYFLADKPDDSWCGFVYRRDWLVKYGKNPETGEAFTGSWDADRTVWTDDVVFPSGETYPVYISDWEWMADIMMDALEGEGIDDGYAMQLSSGGYWGTGEFVTGFGGGSGYYINKDGECVYGYTEDHFRAYLECMSTWAKNGWINKGFEENIGELFWKVDQEAVFSGRVGMWYGRTNQLGCYLDPNDGDASNHLNGAVIFGAPQPINDVYGTADDQNKEPQQFFGNSWISNSSIVITDKAKDKDLGTLLTAIDFFYAGEGSRTAARGFTEEQQAEIQSQFYIDQGISGSLILQDDGKYMLNPEVKREDGLETALNAVRLPQLGYNKDLERGYTAAEADAVDLWMMYEDTGYILGAVTKQLTADQSTDQSIVTSNITAYMDQTVPQFINGELDPYDDGDWEDFVSGLEVLGPYDYCGYINAILGVE